MTKPVVLDFKTWGQWDAWLGRMQRPRSIFRNVACENCGHYADCTTGKDGMLICLTCEMVEAEALKEGAK
jgi:ribosomal protein S27E